MKKNGHIAIELLCNLTQQSGGTRFKESIFDTWSKKSPRSGGKMVSEKSPRFQDFPQIWGKMALNFRVFLIFSVNPNFNTKNLFIHIFYMPKQKFSSKHSFLSLKLPCQINDWKKGIPPDLGDSPRLKICFSPRSGGIPESSV